MINFKLNVIQVMVSRKKSTLKLKKQHKNKGEARKDAQKSKKQNKRSFRKTSTERFYIRYIYIYTELLCIYLYIYIYIYIDFQDSPSKQTSIFGLFQQKALCSI